VNNEYELAGSNDGGYNWTILIPSGNWYADPGSGGFMPIPRDIPYSLLKLSKLGLPNESGPWMGGVELFVKDHAAVLPISTTVPVNQTTSSASTSDGERSLTPSIAEIDKAVRWGGDPTKVFCGGQVICIEEGAWHSNGAPTGSYVLASVPPCFVITKVRFSYIGQSMHNLYDLMGSNDSGQTWATLVRRGDWFANPGSGGTFVIAGNPVVNMVMVTKIAPHNATGPWMGGIELFGIPTNACSTTTGIAATTTSSSTRLGHEATTTTTVNTMTTTATTRTTTATTTTTTTTQAVGPELTTKTTTSTVATTETTGGEDSSSSVPAVSTTLLPATTSGIIETTVAITTAPTEEHPEYAKCLRDNRCMSVKGFEQQRCTRLCCDALYIESEIPECQALPKISTLAPVASTVQSLIEICFADNHCAIVNVDEQKRCRQLCCTSLNIAATQCQTFNIPPTNSETTSMASRAVSPHGEAAAQPSPEPTSAPSQTGGDISSTSNPSAATFAECLIEHGCQAAAGEEETRLCRSLCCKKYDGHRPECEEVLPTTRTGAPPSSDNSAGKGTMIRRERGNAPMHISVMVDAEGTFAGRGTTISAAMDAGGKAILAAKVAWHVSPHTNILDSISDLESCASASGVADSEIEICKGKCVQNNLCIGFVVHPLGIMLKRASSAKEENRENFTAYYLARLNGKAPQ